MQTLSRYFTFQVLNVFLVTTIAGFAVEVRIQSHPIVSCETLFFVVYSLRSGCFGSG